MLYKLTGESALSPSGQFVPTISPAYLTQKSLVNSALFFCCPGPSLKNVEPSLLNTPGVNTMAINTAYPYIKPNVAFVGLDHPYCYDYNLLYDPVLKILGSKFRNEEFFGQKISNFYNTIWIDGTPGNIEEIFARTGPNDLFLWNGNAFETALHIAIWMGFKAIFFVGTDFGGNDYYHDLVLLDSQRASNVNLLQKQVKQLQKLYPLAKEQEVELISCTPKSPINDFMPYMDINKAVEAVKPVIADSNYTIHHCEDVERTRWTEAITRDKGVIVASDANQEWMLKWWMSNYEKYNDYPVIVCDLGMSQPYKDWCEMHPLIIAIMNMKITDYMKPMCKWRPFMLTNSPFALTVTMDIDCEVLGNINELFNWANLGSVVITPDPYNPWVKEYNITPIAAGVIGVKHGHPIITEWCERILNDDNTNFRDDQEVLNKLFLEYRDKFHVAPREYQWLRMDYSYNPNAIIVHWTGIEGKEIIKRKANGENIKFQQKIQQQASPAANTNVDIRPEVKGNPKASICMRVHNEKTSYIEFAIESIIKNTYKNWELLITVDNNPELAEFIQNTFNDDRIDLLSVEEHLGSSECFNKCLERAQGNFIFRLDGDDAYRTDRILGILATFEQHPELDIVQTGAWHMDENSELTEIRTCIPMNPEAYLNGKQQMYAPNPSIVAKKSVYDEIGGFDTNYSNGEDADWNMRAILKHYTWGFLNTPAYLYRRHSESMTATQEVKNGLSEQTRVYKELVDKYKNE